MKTLIEDNSISDDRLVLQRPTMLLFNLHLVVIIGFCTQMIVADCPRLCECKWKSGKESVICLNANLSSVPVHLDAGTQVLDLTGNNLAIIKHDEFSRAGLLNLQKIYISKCRLKNLDRYAFRNLMNLVELDLSYNILTSIPSHTFDSISELRELKLNGNPIKKIHNDAFTNVPQLIRLELSDCKIDTISPNAFIGLEKSLEWLKLEKNNLIQVEAISFTIFQNLHGLELAGNPWNCSCNLRPLREWMLRKNVPFGVPPVCASPPRLKSKPWDKLDLDEFACIPEIFAYESKTNGIEGKNVTMTCRIAGIPEPSVRWLLKNKVIANLSGPSYNNGKKLYMVYLQNNSSDLTIFSADLQDAGIYVCAAENKAGRAEASVTLAVIKKPPEATFSNKILIASVITGIILVLASSLIAICVYTVRKKQILMWRNRDACRREDNYEKIEMNHHKVTTGGHPNSETVSSSEIAVVATRKNGDYRVVPAADTDQDVDEDVDDNVAGGNGETTTTSNGKKSWRNDTIVEKRWNSPEHLLDPDDLHIPRRTLQEARDDIKRTLNSTSGTYNYYDHQPSTSLTQPGTIHLLRHTTNYATTTNTTTTTTTTNYNSELSSLAEDETDKKYPDLIENSSSRRANSEGGSCTDITELFCTLPRKRALIQSCRYRSTDSQSPLLPESRYSSSGGESYYSNSQESNFRRLSDCQKYPPTVNFLSGLNSNRNNRVNKISNSYLNLTRNEKGDEEEVDEEVENVKSLRNLVQEPNSTPLLDVSSLESRISPILGMTNANTYDYHAAQLERFLEEYRSLQKQLTRMKDNLRHDKNVTVTQTSSSSSSSTTIAAVTTTSATTTDTDMITSPNSINSLEESIDFRNFENELTKYLLTKGSITLKNFTSNSGMYNN